MSAEHNHSKARRAAAESGHGCERRHEDGAHRRAKPCAVSRECGACQHVNMPYERQLQRKQDAVAQLFDGVAGEDCVLLPILGMDDPFRFRNKIVSPFAPGKRIATERGSKGGSGGKARGMGKMGAKAKVGAGDAAQRQILCGMYAQGTHRIVAVPDCPVEHECGRRIVQAVAQIMRKFRIAPYNEDAGTGFVRHVVVRVGHESGEVLVTIVTNGAQFPGARNFARELVKRCPEVTTVVQNVNERATNAILGNEEHVLYGPGFILDTLCGLSFRISSHSFYQVNAVQTEVLYRTAVSWALEGHERTTIEGPGASRVAGPGIDGSASASDVVAVDPARLAENDAAHGIAAGVPGSDAAPPSLSILDAYCGTGTIGLVAAHEAGGARVVGVDKVESAIRDARQNAVHNGIENATFVVADAGEYLRQRAAEGDRFDVLVMDPPRAGSTEQFLRAAAESGVTRIVYISCNPHTQVRDVVLLRKLGYRLQRIQPVDMFPHTDHVENIALLERMARHRPPSRG